MGIIDQNSYLWDLQFAYDARTETIQSMHVEERCKRFSLALGLGIFSNQTEQTRY